MEEADDEAGVSATMTGVLGRRRLRRGVVAWWGRLGVATSRARVRGHRVGGAWWSGKTGLESLTRERLTREEGLLVDYTKNEALTEAETGLGDSSVGGLRGRSKSMEGREMRER